MIVSSLVLRPYQVAALDELRRGFAEGARKQLLYMPTGAGKTETSVDMMFHAHNKGTRSAFLLDRIVLCEQTSARLDRYGIPHGVLQSGHWRFRPYEHIQVCSAQTIEKRGSFPGLKLLFVDECHNMRKQTIEFIKNRTDVRVVGLTATPFTKGLGAVYERVVCTTTTEELVGQGNLVPLRPFLSKQIDMAGAKKVAGEWSEGEAAARGIRITGDVVAEWVAKTQQIFGGPRKTICFCAGVAHGEDLARKFADAGFNFVSVSYKDSDDFKREVFAEFAKPDTSIHGLIATDILTKGFDCPDVMVGISARPFSKSFSSHVQQIGRVMRPYPGKEFALWLDHSGNYLRFLDDWERVYSEGVKELPEEGEKAKREPTEKEVKKAVCPRCGAIFPPANDTCAHCGFQRMRRNGVVVLPGELEEMAAQAKRNRADEQRFYSEALGLCEEWGKKPGWAFYLFKDKFGREPTGLSKDPIEPSRRTRDWIRGQIIRKAKAREGAAA